MASILSTSLTSTRVASIINKNLWSQFRIIRLKDGRNRKSELLPRSPAMLPDLNATVYWPRTLFPGTFPMLQSNFFQKTTTPYLQPLDQGIIASVKARFRKGLVLAALDKIESGLYDKMSLHKIDLLTAMKWVKEIWNELPSSTSTRSLTRNKLLKKS
jgi:hypothetical protein